jgi:hypothetical protein
VLLTTFKRRPVGSKLDVSPQEAGSAPASCKIAEQQ